MVLITIYCNRTGKRQLHNASCEALYNFKKASKYPEGLIRYNHFYLIYVL